MRTLVGSTRSAARRLALPLVLLLALTGCGVDAGEAGALVRLRVVAGPVCPVETVPADPACAPHPLEGVRLRVAGVAGASSTIASDKTGVATIRLALGDYTVEPLASDRALGFPAPFELMIVDLSATLERDVLYDTGIR
jgi:hypothetical protein